jgi:RimJ/RimL family protein N-acetyltransferase
MLITNRLKIQALTLQQLKIGIRSLDELSNLLNLSLVPNLFEGIVQRTVSMKIQKMKIAPVELHEWYTYWLIVIKREEVGVGLAGFKGSPDQNGSVEIGYGLVETYRGKRYMSEAVQALIGWAFLHSECNKVTATDVLTDNYASQKTLLHSGFNLDSQSPKGLNYSISKQK